MKMEPTESSETSAFNTRTPGRYPKENALHIKHGESLKSRIFKFICAYVQVPNVIRINVITIPVSVPEMPDSFLS